MGNDNQLNLSEQATKAVTEDVKAVGGAEPVLVVVFDQAGNCHDFLTYGQEPDDPETKETAVTKVCDFAIAVGNKNPACCYYWKSGGVWKKKCWC